MNKEDILRVLLQQLLRCFGYKRILYNVDFNGGTNILKTPNDRCIVMDCSFDGGRR